MATVPIHIHRLNAQQVSQAVISAAAKVHSELGPGLLQNTYATCLQHELGKRSLRCAAEVSFPVIYEGVKLETGYRVDLLVEDLMVVEVKAVEAISALHHAQVVSYLKLSRKSIALLLNFNVIHFKDGIKRFANGSGWI